MATGIMLAAGGGLALFCMWIAEFFQGLGPIMCWGPFVVVTGIGLLLIARAWDLLGKLRLLAQEARCKAELQYGSQIAQLDEDIQAGRACIAQLQTEMDELAREL